MDLLETILASTDAARVVAEQHDINAIHIEASDVDRGIAALRRGPWDAAEYGITREEAERRMREADTPEARERVLADLRDRAIRRAGLDTSNGRVAVMVAGEAAWHRLGVQVTAAVTSGEAIRLAGLDWKVVRLPLTFEWKGAQKPQNAAYALVREDTGEFLNQVGPRYQPIQNADGFAFLDEVLAKYGARYETAGAIYGGRKVWMQAVLPASSFTLAGGDENKAYVMFSNAHGGEAAWVYPTSHRVVCANTYRVSFGDRDRGFSIRHTGDVKAKVKVKKAQELLGLAVRGFDAYRQAAETMVRLPLDVSRYAGEVLDVVLDMHAAEAAAQATATGGLEASLIATEAEAKLERLKERKTDLLEEILRRYESGTCAPRGTAWAAFNAVTETADHSQEWGPSRGKDLESRRMESTLDGEADRMKQVAYRLATAAR
jgi:phage/plasmid-like protein (TIGR03299 family)